MNDPLPNANLHLRFLGLPDGVRAWLTSETVHRHIVDWNERLDLFADLRSALPTLITRLVTRDIVPQNFAYELKQGLFLTFPEAKELALEIVEKVLQPIERELRNEFIEIGDIAQGEKTPVSAAVFGERPVVAPEVSRIEPKRVDFGVSEPMPKTPPPLPPEPQRPMPEPETNFGDQPFLIHEEKSEAFPQAPREPRSIFGFRPIQPPKQKPAESKPIPVRIESPEAPKKPVSRVVHYSNLRTPLDDK